MHQISSPLVILGHLSLTAVNAKACLHEMSVICIKYRHKAYQGRVGHDLDNELYIKTTIFI